MNAPAIVKLFDVVRDQRIGLRPRRQVNMMDKLVLQRREEALRHRIVLRHLAAVHARLYPVLCQDRLVGTRTVPN